MSEATDLARQAKKDFKQAYNRYIAALQECLVPGTPITYYRGMSLVRATIVGTVTHGQFVTIKSDKTGKEYAIALYHIREI